MSMHGRIPLWAALGLCAVLACEDDSTGPELERNFTATLAGTNERPMVTTNATGSATFTLNEAETELSYSITVQNLSSALTPGGAHIHLGNPETMLGTVIVGLPVLPVNNSTVTGTIQSSATLSLGLSWASLIDLIRNENTYVNVHTTNHPGGEIRGQLVSTP
jgi:hypothetical protein